MPEASNQPTRGRAHLSGEIFTHRLLWHTAQSLREAASSESAGTAHYLLGALVFVFFALEAYLNYLGPHVAPKEWTDERRFFSQNKTYRGTLGKLELLAHRLHIPLDKDTRPYCTVRTLNKKRDFLAHPRPELVDEYIEYTDPATVPRSKEPAVFGLADVAFLDEAMTDVEALCDSLQATAQADVSEQVLLSPRAFVGMLWHQGGTL
jgi:hypothetical protein